jgi:NAD(P)H dehydrogenase (quinone)
MNIDEISSGTPYGASTLAEIDGSRRPSENEWKLHVSRDGM